MRKMTQSFNIFLFLSCLSLMSVQANDKFGSSDLFNTSKVELKPEDTYLNLFSMDYFWDFFRSKPLPDLSNEVNSNGIPFSIAKPEEPRRTSDLMRRINDLPGAKLTGHELNAEGDCVAQFGVVDLAPFSSLMICSPSQLYNEVKDNSLANHGDRVRQESYVLQVDPDKAQSYCDCVKSRMNGKDADQAVTTAEQKRKRSKTLDNLINDSIVRLAVKFNDLVPKVMYSLTSLEMASVHISEIFEPADGVKSASLNMTQRGVLSRCAPGELSGFLKNTNERAPSLCSEKGMKRMGLGFIHGRGSSCQEEHMKNLPECAEKGSKVIINPRKDFVDEMIGNHISNSGALESADIYLNRHHNQFEERKTDEERKADGEGKIDSKKSDFSPAFEYSNLVRNLSDRAEAKIEVEKSMMNELSTSGQELWEQNHKPIILALKAILDRGNNADIVTESDLEIDEKSMKYFRNQIGLNPFLSKHFTKFQTSLDSELKSQIIDYVNIELIENINIVAKDRERRNNDIQITDVAAAMFYTFDEEYQKLVENCEDIQKTLISLCQAAGNEEDGIDKISSFFTDPRLLSLFMPDIEKIHNGTNSTTSGSDLAAATVMFCQETKMSGGVAATNTKMRNFNSLVENDEYLGRFDKISSFLELDRKERNKPDYSRTEALAGLIIINGGSEKERPIGDHQNVANTSNSAPMEVLFRNAGDEVIKETGKLDDGQQDSPFRAFAGSPFVATSKKISDVNIKEKSDDRPVANPKQNAILKAFPVEEAVFFPNTFENTRTIEEKPVSMFDTKKLVAEKLSNFSDDFINPLNPSSTKIEAEKLPSEVQTEKSQSIDPVQAEMLAQLEKMREREELMAKELETIKAQADTRAKEEQARRYENQLAGLQDQIKNLTAQVREREEAPKAAKITSESARGASVGTGLSSSGASRSSSIRNSASSSPAFGNSGGGNKIQAASPGAAANNAAARNLGANSAARSSFSAGNVSLTGQTLGQGAVRAAQRAVSGISAAPRDSSLTLLALSADGNIAVRETSDPNVVERIVFKEENGEIVYVDGLPVIEKSELVVMEDEELEKVAEEASLEEENSRAPASIEDEMKALERSTNPRSALYDDLKIMIDQNVSE